MAEGRSALAEFGISQFPIGTKQEVEEAGLDLSKVACCAPQSKDGSIRGCPLYDRCRFDSPSMGGFKDVAGPRYIGYRYIDPATGDAAEEIHKCHAWVIGMQASSDAGAAERRVTNGRRGKVIRVIAQEGEYITTRYNLPINGKGEVVQPMPEMMDILKENDVKFSTLPGEVSIGRRMFELRRQVPRFPRLGDNRIDTYAQRVAERDMGNESKDREYLDAGASAPLQEVAEAVVVKRGPGRPRKVRDDEAAG